MTEEDDTLGWGYMTPEQQTTELLKRIREYRHKIYQAENELRRIGYKGLT